MPDTVHFVVPGRLDQLTGGYLYDRRIVEGLRSIGWTVHVIELLGTFPAGDQTASAFARRALAALPDGALTVIDGLALPAIEADLKAQSGRIKIMALVHHPAARETGLSEANSRKLARRERSALALAQRIVVPSSATASDMSEMGVDEGRVTVVAPGTEVPDERPDRPAPPPFLLLSVASVIPRKGHDVLVDALGRLTHLDWHLTCIGSLSRDSAMTRKLREAIEDGGLADRIDLVGEWSPDRMGAAYSAAHIFVLPSHLEGYGMALAEALGHGAPVVSTLAGAIPETVPQYAGLLVPPGDPAALAEALERAMSDPELYAKLSDTAWAAGRRLPRWTDVAGQFAEELDALRS